MRASGWVRRLGRMAALAAVGASLALPNDAGAQDFPTRPVRIIVGPSPDVFSRIIAERLQEMWKQPVIIEQRPGGGGKLAVAAVTGAQPDGHTLLFATPTFTLATAMRLATYDFAKDFEPTAMMGLIAYALVVHPSVPAQSVEELVAYAKANPGKLNYGAPIGTPPQLMGELFRTLAGIDIVFVPYKGAALALTDLLAGRTQMTILSTAVIVPPILAGKLRALAVTSTARWHELPDVPTMTEAGFAGFPQGSWTAVVAPAGTSADVIARLNGTINEGLRSAELHDSLIKLGAEIKIDTPPQLGALLADESRKWAEVIKSSGATVN